MTERHGEAQGHKAESGPIDPLRVKKTQADLVVGAEEVKRRVHSEHVEGALREK